MALGISSIVSPKTLSQSVGNVYVHPGSYYSTGAGTWAMSFGSGDGFYVHNGGSTTDGDNITYKVWLPAGSYTLTMGYFKNTNHGIIKVDVDGTTALTQDAYAAESHGHISTQAGVTIATSGVHDVTLKVDGKNGASSDYWCVCSFLNFARTA